MAEISAKLVKELRDRTGLGMMECKKPCKKQTATSKPQSITCVNQVKQKLLKKQVTLLLMAPSLSPKKVTKPYYLK